MHESPPQMEYDCVQPSPLPQQAPPIAPHAPPAHAPSTQVPPPAPLDAAGHALPLPTHVSPAQQPPASQAWPSQQGSPGPPHAGVAWQRAPVRLNAHSVPGAVQ